MKRCIVIAAGPIEAPERLESLWQSRPDDLVIAADGGLHNAALFGIQPDIVLGDMDSLDPADAPEGVRVYPVRKNDTDAMLAVKAGIEAGCREFLILGALGGRLDHTYANIQMLGYLLEQGCSGQLLDGMHQVMMVRNGGVRLKSSFKHLSVFSYSDRCLGVSESGVGYTLSGAELTSTFPLGVSNYQLADEPAVISVEQGTLLLILSDCT